MKFELNDQTKAILGRLCFQCITIANILRKDGHNIPKKAEAEQAHVIHWLLHLYFEHGDKYAEVGNNLLTAIENRSRKEAEKLKESADSLRDIAPPPNASEGHSPLTESKP